MSPTLDPFAAALPVPAAAELACLLEATAPKLGNVHPAASFEDLQFVDFLTAAVALGDSLRTTAGQPLGARIFDAVTRSGRVARSNANLGILLLVVPLSAAAESGQLSRGSVGGLLQRLTADDAQHVYAAIRAARPGGMGTTASMDIAGPAPVSLLEAMRAAEDRDRIARQWVSDFEDIFETVAPALCDAASRTPSILDAICRVHLELLATWPDSLIVRKHGELVATDVQAEARRLLRQIEATQSSASAASRTASGDGTGDVVYQYKAYRAFDARLRHGTRRINPGTTADLVAAGLFVCLVQGSLQPPTWKLAT